jgi:hypothetical protein
MMKSCSCTRYTDTFIRAVAAPLCQDKCEDVRAQLNSEVAGREEAEAEVGCSRFSEDTLRRITISA